MNKATQRVIEDIQIRCSLYKDKFYNLRYRSDGVWKIDKYKHYNLLKKCFIDLRNYIQDLTIAERSTVKIIDLKLIERLGNAWSWYNGIDSPHEKCIKYSSLPLEILEKLERI